MDGPGDCHIEQHKSDREAEAPSDGPYMWNPKSRDTSALTHKTERDSDLENEFMVARGKGWGEGIVRESGINMYALIYLKWITSKDLLYST